MPQRRLILFVLMLCLSAPAMAAKKSVAVLNFTNYGSKDIKFLSSAIPESVSTTLSENEDISVVERRNLGRVIDELSLEQTGLVDTKDVSRAGRLAKADVLILGSVSGDRNNVILTMKAVDVATGKVLDGKTVKASMADIFDKSSQAARTMAALISGKSIGRLSVSSTPSRAEVYIDGMSVGQTPIVEYKLTQGKHRVKVVKDGYIDFEASFKIDADEHMKFSPVLGESNFQNRTEIGFGVSFLQPVSDKFNGVPHYYILVGHTFERLIVSGELGFSQFDHSQTHFSTFDPNLTLERWYNTFWFHGHLSYMPFPNWTKFTPYFGVMIGMINLNDYKYNTNVKNDKEKVDDQTMFSFGGKVGANILPFGNVALFVEARYYFQPYKLNRIEYESDLFGALSETQTKLYLHIFTIGGGVKYFF
jgi:TolB-like protein